jgi:translation initiation factor IF-3
VGADGNQVGIIDTKDALALAEQQDLDLVEVAPTADPPVCRIMDYGKYKYEQAVKQREARKRQSNVIVKEMKLRPKISSHDYETKKGHVIRFLRQGAKVKVTIMFRGRETMHPEVGERLLLKMAGELSDIAKIELQPKLDGRNMTMVMVPLKEAIIQKPKPEPKHQGPPPAQKEAVEETAEEPAEETAEEPAEQKSKPVKVTRAEGG